MPSSSAVAHHGVVALSSVTVRKFLSLVLPGTDLSSEQARLVCPTFLGVRQRFGSFYLAMIPIRYVQYLLVFRDTDVWLRRTNRDIRVDYTLRAAG